ncbi:MAG: hypothetical protein BWY49_00469 [Candidatus Omnitrophica bacterium ADurb.Bin314]|nr:MAG: hypothetical protein BWY49_00469 [Candidatus Omnitrophica bacterium ADurb.Bin314]
MIITKRGITVLELFGDLEKIPRLRHDSGRDRFGPGIDHGRFGGHPVEGLRGNLPVPQEGVTNLTDLLKSDADTDRHAHAPPAFHKEQELDTAAHLAADAHAFGMPGMRRIIGRQFLDEVIQPRHESRVQFPEDMLGLLRFARDLEILKPLLPEDVPDLILPQFFFEVVRSHIIKIDIRPLDHRVHEPGVLQDRHHFEHHTVRNISGGFLDLLVRPPERLRRPRLIRSQVQDRQLPSERKDLRLDEVQIGGRRHHGEQRGQLRGIRPVFFIEIMRVFDQKRRDLPDQEESAQGRVPVKIKTRDPLLRFRRDIPSRRDPDQPRARIFRVHREQELEQILVLAVVLEIQGAEGFVIPRKERMADIGTVDRAQVAEQPADARHAVAFEHLHESTDQAGHIVLGADLPHLESLEQGDPARDVKVSGSDCRSDFPDMLFCLFREEIRPDQRRIYGAAQGRVPRISRRRHVDADLDIERVFRKPSFPFTEQAFLLLQQTGFPKIIPRGCDNELPFAGLLITLEQSLFTARELVEIGFILGLRKKEDGGRGIKPPNDLDPMGVLAGAAGNDKSEFFAKKVKRAKNLARRSVPPDKQSFGLAVGKARL